MTATAIWPTAKNPIKNCVTVFGAPVERVAIETLEARINPSIVTKGRQSARKVENGWAQDACRCSTVQFFLILRGTIAKYVKGGVAASDKPRQDYGIVSHVYSNGRNPKSGNA